MPPTKPPTSKLLQESLRLLDEAIAAGDESLAEIAARSGVGWHWLGKLRQGGIADPGVNKVEALHSYLTAKRAAGAEASAA